MHSRRWRSHWATESGFRPIAQAGHAQGVDPLPVAHGVITKQALGLETEFVVERDGGLVVGVNREFNAVQVHPVVGNIQRRCQQLRTDAFALPRDRDCHTDAAGVAATNPRKSLQPEMPDHRTLMQRHQLHHPFVFGHQPLAPDLGRLLDHYLNPLLPRKALLKSNTRYLIAPGIDSEELLADACETLTSAKTMATDFAGLAEGSHRHVLLGTAQMIMLGELAVNRALDNLEVAAETRA